MLANDSLVSESVADDATPRARPGEPLPGEAKLSESSPGEARPSAARPHAEAVSEDTPALGPVLTSERQAALRALRNLEATEARLERNAKREADEARGKLVQELLPVLDNLDRTIRAAHASRSDPAMLEGVRLVRHQLEGVLRGYGVERVEAQNQRFDPGLHEAIGMTAVSDPRRHGVVVHQAEPGYRFAGKLLRPAKVTVGKLVAQPDVGHRPLWR